MPRIYGRAEAELERAREKYRRAYNKGYNLSEQGYYDRANKILARANSEWEAAQLLYEKEKGGI